MDDQFRSRFRRSENTPPRAHVPVERSPRPETQSRPSARPSKPRSEASQKPGVQHDYPPPHKKAKRQRRGGHKILWLLLVLLLLTAGGVAGYWLWLKPRKITALLPKVATPSSPNPKEIKKSSENIRLLAVGDSLTYTSINQAAQKGSDYDYAQLMTAIKPLFAKSDIRFCSQSVPAGGAAGGISGPPTFNAPSAFAKGLEDTGCNLINLASANTNDKGQAAIDASVANFDKHTNILAAAGANRSAEEQNVIRYFTVKGLKFAFLAYTTSSNVKNPTPFGVNVYDQVSADAQIKEARAKAGLVIVSMHWGNDRSADVTPEQDAIGQHLSEQKVDIVLGNGPHVIEPVKILTGPQDHQTIVWYSLGNFLSSQVPIDTLVGGMAVMDIESVSGRLLNPRLLPLYMHYEWTAEQKQRQNDGDLLARKNFQLLPLDQAAVLLAKSQNGTTISAQQERIKGIVSKYFPIPLITSADL